MLFRPRPALFLIGTGLAVAVLFALLIGSFRLQYGWHTVDSYGRCRSIQEKIDFGQQLSSPKIVFIGGSSVHWGINAEKAGKALHLEGFNFGSCAALGPWSSRHQRRAGGSQTSRLLRAGPRSSRPTHRASGNRFVMVRPATSCHTGTSMRWQQA